VWPPYAAATAKYYAAYKQVYESIKGGDAKEVAAMKKYLGIVSNLNAAAKKKNTSRTASLVLDWSDYGTTFMDRFCWDQGWTP
jgi:hypothetical protein